MEQIKKSHVETAMAVIMLAVITIFSINLKNVKASEKNDKKEFCVVVDAGHGGKDPGKVAVDGSLEKDINLKIALKLKDYLEADNIKVVLTREDDNGLYSENASNKKRSEMEKRCEIIEESQCDLMVSIHQNSYSSEGVKGAQTFYYSGSAEGEKLAKIIQDKLITEVDNSNGRQAKANDNYYMLEKIQCTAVLVECGFLSNYGETELLNNDNYQEKLAVAIGNGVLEYLGEK